MRARLGSRSASCRIHSTPSAPSVAIDDIEGLTFLGLNPLVLPRSSRFLKRIVDIVGALVGLVARRAGHARASRVAIKLDSAGPVLFRQRRVGSGGRPFRVLKFRTMVVDAEARQRGAPLAQSSDPDWLKLDATRASPASGAFLRRTSLDELPQLWNVLMGDMSLVGPAAADRLRGPSDRGLGAQPARPDPGVTGLWQVLGRTSIPFEDMVNLDYLYVTNWSLWFDVKLLLRTLPVLLSKRGAN